MTAGNLFYRHERRRAERERRMQKAEDTLSAAPTPGELRDCEEWRELSRMVRDERRACERCGVMDNLHVHHVEPLWKAPHRLLDVTNLRVLCGRCHAIVEPMVRRPKKPVDLHPMALAMHNRKPARARMVTSWRPKQPG